MEEKENDSDTSKINSFKDIENISRLLAESLFSIHKKPLNNMKHNLKDLICKQDECMNLIQLENKKLCDMQEDIELINMFSVMSSYEKKLESIKNEIIGIHQKVIKLKKKALRIQQTKQKRIVDCKR